MLTLRTQAFLAFLIFAAALLLGVFLYSRSSFESNFESYILQRENERNADLIEALRRHYEAEGSFRYFAESPHAWDVLTRPRRGLDGRPRPDLMLPEPSETGLAPPTELAPRDFRSRLLLLDANQKHLAGRYYKREQYVNAEINLSRDGKTVTVGYLAFPVNQVLRDVADLQFIDQEQNRLSRMIALALVGAFAFAIPLAFLLTRKLKRITNLVNDLSQGRYDTQLHLGGRDEFATLAQQLNHLGQTLAASEASRKRWVADISHELRTPLSVLKADLEALEDGIRPFSPETLARLQAHTNRLHHLINDLYELSLTDIGAMTYRKTRCDLTQIARACAASMMTAAEQQQLRLHTHLPTTALMCFADESRLQQLLINLLNNSILYTQAPGEIFLTLENLNDRATITVEDTAPGVHPDELHHLFDRLYRGESSRNRATGGAGLGLSLCYNIVSAHQGHITAEPSRYGGLKIVVELPLDHHISV